MSVLMAWYWFPFLSHSLPVILLSVSVTFVAEIGHFVPKSYSLDIAYDLSNPNLTYDVFNIQMNDKWMKVEGYV